MKSLPALYSELTKPARHALWTILAVAVLLTYFGVTLFDTFLSAPNWFFRLANAIPMALAVIAYIAAYAVLNKRVNFGAWLFFITMLIAMLAVPFIAEGYALSGAMLVILVTVLVPLQVFKGNKITIATISGLTVAGLMIIIDQFYTGLRVPAASIDVQTARIAALLLFLFLFASIVMLYNGFNLRTKLLVLTLGATFLSVGALAGAVIAFSQVSLNQKTEEMLLQSAQSAANAIDTYIKINVDLLTSQARLPILREYLQAPEAERLALRPELRLTMHELASRDFKYIGSYALLDATGTTLWDTYPPDIGKNKADRDYFRRPMDSGRTFISPVRFSPTSPDYGFYIGAPIFDASGERVIGVLRIRLRATLLADIIKNSVGTAGEQSYGILLDEYNIILADAKNPEHFGRTPGALDEATIALLKSENRLPAGTTAENISLNMDEFANSLRSYIRTPFFTSRDAAFSEPVQGAIVPLTARLWKVVIVQPVAVAQAPIRSLTRIITLLALAISFGTGVGTLWVSRTITTPVARLTQVAEEISAGNLEARVSIRSQDELGTLAETLNNMSSQLEQTLMGLEQTISQRTAELEQRSQELEQRTKDLEVTTMRSERRAAQLLAVSTVANTIANIQNLDELLPRITQVISNQFGFYHVGIFLNDASNTYAVLRAANSEGGQRMLARGHRLKIGEVGIVGAVAGSGRPRIALDTGEDAAYFNNPDLPTTRSEMALPLRSGARVIGVLDVQSTEPNAFTDEDIEIITILADQVSTAIRNAQLFEESQIASKETQLLLQAYARDQWRRVARAQRTGGYRFDGVSVVPLQKRPKSDGIVSIPIVVRGQTIGKLGIRTPQGRPLNQDELDIIQSVTERLAIAAENARLLQESQERASKEQAIGEITAKIGASINLRSILQTAVEELGQILPGSEVTIKLTNNQASDTRSSQ